MSSNSQALKEFIKALDLSINLMKIDLRNYSNPPKANEAHSVQALRGGASVLMVAAFEQFIREMFIENIDKIDSCRPAIQLQRLPQKMQIHAIYTSMEWAMKGEPYSESKQKIDRIIDIDLACKNLLASRLYSEVFGEVGGNPNSKRITDMFKRIGVSGDNIFLIIKPEFEKKYKKRVDNMFIKNKLDEIVNRRHIVAHTADAFKISRSDLNESVKFLRFLAEVLDSEIHRFIKGVISNATACPV